MSFWKRLSGKKDKTPRKPAPIARKRDDQPDVYDTPGGEDEMTWALKKAKLTLPFFEKQLRNPKESYLALSIKVRFDD